MWKVSHNDKKACYRCIIINIAVLVVVVVVLACEEFRSRSPATPVLSKTTEGPAADYSQGGVH